MRVRFLRWAVSDLRVTWLEQPETGWKICLLVSKEAPKRVCELGLGHTPQPLLGVNLKTLPEVLQKRLGNLITLQQRSGGKLPLACQIMALHFYIRLLEAVVYGPLALQT